MLSTVWPGACLHGYAGFAITLLSISLTLKSKGREALKALAGLEGAFPSGVCRVCHHLAILLPHPKTIRREAQRALAGLEGVFFSGTAGFATTLPSTLRAVSTVLTLKAKGREADRALAGLQGPSSPGFAGLAITLLSSLILHVKDED